MTRTLILGANGGVGQHLVKQMHAQGEDFTAAVRKRTTASVSITRHFCNID